MSETKHERGRKPAKCPKCGAAKVLRILYGMPDLDAIKKLRENVHLGGCCIPIGGPTWHCDKCEHEWGELRIEDLDQ